MLLRNSRITSFDLMGLRETGALPLFPDKGALTHHWPRASGGMAFGQRALSEGDCALCGERQTMLPRLRATVIIVCAVVGTMVRHARQLPSQICRRHVCDALRGTGVRERTEGFVYSDLSP